MGVRLPAQKARAGCTGAGKRDARDAIRPRAIGVRESPALS
jgi:hypothetical protein